MYNGEGGSANQRLIIFASKLWDLQAFCLLKYSFCTHYLPFLPYDSLACHSTRHRQGLERALSSMVVVISLNHIDMQRHASILGPATQTMMNHLRVQIAHHRRGEIEITNEERARGDVNDGTGEGFIERSIGVSEASYAGASAEGGGESSTEGKEGVFGCVMVVDCEPCK